MPGAARSTAGKTGEYHSAVFDIQPAKEGVGYSDQQLIDLGTTVGIEGADLATYTKCVQDGTYLAWSANSNQEFVTAGVGGTPTAYLNGVELNGSDLADIEGLTAEDRSRDREVIGALATSIPSPDQSVWHLGPLPLRAYALCILVGIFVAMWVGDRRWVARGGNKGLVYDVAVWAVPFGIIGGRLYHVLTDWPTYFGSGGSGLRGAIAIWEGGLGIWGAIALGAVGAWIGCRRHGVPLPPFTDALAVGVPLAQAIGRLGNWFNQELFGKPTDLPWGLEIDPVNRPNGFEQFATFHPTFLYEALWLVGVAGLVAWADRRWTLGHGRAFALYVAAYCVGRLGMEMLRIDPATQVGGIRINVFTSIVVGAGGRRLLRGQCPHASRTRGPGGAPGHRRQVRRGFPPRSEGTLGPGEVRTFGASIPAVQCPIVRFRVPHS